MSSKDASTLPESHARFLIATLRAEFSPRSEGDFKSHDTPSLDWSLLVATARKHGVLPLVYKTWRRVKPTGLPDAVLEDVAAQYRQNAARNLALFAELQNLLDRFAGHDIPVLPFKGPVLALTAYGDLNLRQFTDLDLLIYEDDVEPARGLLQRAGYRPVPSKQLSWSCLFQHEARGIAVDLQWAFGHPRFVFPIDLERLWGQARHVEIKGQGILQPALDDQLLILAGHGGKHCWSRVGWVCDFAAFTRAVDPQIDWSAALHYAEAVGGRRLLLLACALAEAVLGRMWPARVCRRMEREPRLQHLLEVSRENLFAPDHTTTWDYGGLDFEGVCQYYIQVHERLRERWTPYRLLTRRRLGKLRDALR